MNIAIDTEKIGKHLVRLGTKMNLDINDRIFRVEYYIIMGFIEALEIPCEVEWDKQTEQMKTVIVAGERYEL